MKALTKLLSIGGPAIRPDPSREDFSEFNINGLFGNQLREFLQQRNGFYACESALHVFPASVGGSILGVQQWNSSKLWRYEYGDLGRDAFFFAEDAFGNQFCFSKGQVCLFDAETGELSKVAADLEGWAGAILKDYRILTGHPLMHDWQVENGAIPQGKRLMPKIPFVLGGKYSLDNIYALDSVSAMKSRGNLALQLRDLPDGTKVEFRVVP
jgi:hypothetical protein